MEGKRHGRWSWKLRVEGSHLKPQQEAEGANWEWHVASENSKSTSGDTLPPLGPKQGHQLRTKCSHGRDCDGHLSLKGPQ